MKVRKTYTCPLEITHDIIKGKWKPLILWLLKDHTKSLSELNKEINDISEKILIEQLQELIDFSIVKKRKYAGYPLKVEYSLSENGVKLIEAIKILQSVGMELIEQNRSTQKSK